MKRCAKVVLTLLVPAMSAFGCGQSQPPQDEVQAATPHCDVPKEPGPDGKVPPPCPPQQAHGTSQARSSYYHRPYFYGGSSSRGWFRSTAPSPHPITTHTTGTHSTGTHTTSSHNSPSHTSGTTHHTSSVSRGGFGSTGSHHSGLS